MTLLDRFQTWNIQDCDEFPYWDELWPLHLQSYCSNALRTRTLDNGGHLSDICCINLHFVQAVGALPGSFLWIHRFCLWYYPSHLLPGSCNQRDFANQYLFPSAFTQSLVGILDIDRKRLVRTRQQGEELCKYSRGQRRNATQRINLSYQLCICFHMDTIRDTVRDLCTDFQIWTVLIRYSLLSYTSWIVTRNLLGSIVLDMTVRFRITA